MWGTHAVRLVDGRKGRLRLWVVPHLVGVHHAREAAVGHGDIAAGGRKGEVGRRRANMKGGSIFLCHSKSDSAPLASRGIRTLCAHAQVLSPQSIMSRKQEDCCDTLVHCA